ncbi:MAG: DUF3450 family protein [Verrucomicrobiota bacterium]
MTKTKLVSLIAAGLALASPLAVNAAPDLSETRETLKQWVELKKLISEEEAEWKVAKETLQEAIDLRETEIDSRREQIDKKQEDASAADAERAKLTEQENELKQSAAVVSTKIGDMEQKALKLAKIFPRTLADKLRPITERIPKDEKTASSLGLSQRVQNIVALLLEVEKFNGDVILENDMQQINGENVSVKTIYIGLAIAYYVDGTGSEAGILTPSEEGWERESRNDLAPAIAQAVAIFEKEAAPEFVNLPVSVN